VSATTLTAAQLAGDACIVCGLDFAATGRPSVAMGRIVDGRQLWTCTEPCALLTCIGPSEFPADPARLVTTDAAVSAIQQGRDQTGDES
jgi:hypothetical protein